ncbi:MAG TPA: FKBP-type peptidyl-prolyl cis-trans isomerase [Nitrososphaeraceae archaeon]|jgi:peptidylprolyl isomerase|nr:FKBP-type peptidyl-prolyl cis-trans isomerase [Nitrososphaeraceae archaeon]
MTLERGSLILVDYTAKVKDSNEIFETTREEEAKKSELFDPTHKYEPRLISIGEGWVLKGLDEALAASNIGDKINVEITPDKGFGERDPNKVRMVAQRKLGEKADEVRVGDVIEIDHRTGIVRYVGSGRVQIDFNHRFAGRTLTYDVDLVKKVESDDDKIRSLIKRRLPVDDEKIKINLKGFTLEIDLPEETLLAEGLQIIKRAVANDVFKFVPSLKDIKFIESFQSPTLAQHQQENDQNAKIERQVDAKSEENEIETVESKNT